MIGQQSDGTQPVKLTHAIVNINKATSWPPVDIWGDKCGHYIEIKGQSRELGGGHSNNLRLKKWFIYTEVVKLQKWSELEFWLYSNYPIYYIDLT